MKLTLPAGSVEDLGGGVVRVTLPGATLSDATPEANAGSGDAGVGAAASRGDHAHPAAGGGVQVATVTLTNAQFKALPTTPFDILAAPGVGLVNLIMQVHARLNTPDSIGYTNFNEAYCAFAVPALGAGYYDEVTGGAFGTPGGTFTDFVFTPATVGAVSPWQGLDANAALQIVMDNGAAGNLTGGDDANSLRVVVIYVTVPA